MNILFLTLSKINSINDSTIYTDLLKDLSLNGNNIFVVSPIEKKEQQKTNLTIEDNISLLQVRIGNIFNVNILEKGISTLRIERQYLQAIKKYYSDNKFDLVLYSTPPITFAKVIHFIKKRDGAKSYLLLKDIFPQNAVDLGMINYFSPIYTYFRTKEKELYKLSDFIGCMSPANVEYILKHNSFLKANIVDVLPNSIAIQDIKKITEYQKKELRSNYNIPGNAIVYIYGGNLGKPQDIPFLIKCLELNNKLDKFFIICGTGTEYHLLLEFIEKKRPNNVLLINGLSKSEYDNLMKLCDVGLIFLDYRFTIPNFPSRCLSYMSEGMPILACTDEQTDIGKLISKNNLGWWCKSNSPENFSALIATIGIEEIKMRGSNSRAYLEKNYSVKKSSKKILADICSL